LPIQIFPSPTESAILPPSYRARIFRAFKGKGFDVPPDEPLNDSFTGPRPYLFPCCGLGAEKQTIIPQIEQPVFQVAEAGNCEIGRRDIERSPSVLGEEAVRDVSKPVHLIIDYVTYSHRLWSF
jgi:hypothetical protein